MTLLDFFIYKRKLSTFLLIFMKSLRFYGKIVTEYKRRENMKRSMYVGRVREEHIGQEITLKDGLPVVGTWWIDLYRPS